MSIENIEARLKSNYAEIEKLLHDMQHDDPRRGRRYFALRAKLIYGKVEDLADEVYTLEQEHSGKATYTDGDEVVR